MFNKKVYWEDLIDSPGKWFPIVIVIVLIGLVYFLMIQPTLNKAEKIADALASGIKIDFGFSPKIQIDSTVVVKESKPILELAVVERGVQHDYEYENTFLFSTKKYRISGTYLAKAGYNLNDQFFLIVIQKIPARVEVYLPSPQILSFEQTDYQIELEENGWWNKLSTTEKEDAFKQMKDAAKAEVLSVGILNEVRIEMEGRIKDYLKDFNVPVEFHYQSQ